MKEALGVADRQVLFRLVEAILTRDPAAALHSPAIYTNMAMILAVCARTCSNIFVISSLVKVNPELASLADLPDHEIAEVRQQAAACSLEDLQRIFTITLPAEEEISKTVYPQLVVEMMLVKLASQPAVFPIEEAFARLEASPQSLSENGPAAPATRFSEPARPQSAAPVSSLRPSPPPTTENPLDIRPSAESPPCKSSGLPSDFFSSTTRGRHLRVEEVASINTDDNKPGTGSWRLSKKKKSPCSLR